MITFCFIHWSDLFIQKLVKIIKTLLLVSTIFLRHLDLRDCCVDVNVLFTDQVEGAFMQGVGLFTLEELRYSPQGYLYTRGPGMYKIPAFGDIPTELRVSLLRDAPNERAIFSSKVQSNGLSDYGPYGP